MAVVRDTIISYPYPEALWCRDIWAMITTVRSLIITIIPFYSSLLFIILPTHLIVVGLLGWVEIHQTQQFIGRWNVAHRPPKCGWCGHECCREHICARMLSWTYMCTSEDPQGYINVIIIRCFQYNQPLQFTATITIPAHQDTKTHCSPRRMSGWSSWEL